MITVKTAGYTAEDKTLLYNVLDKGLKIAIPTCNGLCEECKHRKPCTDVNLVLSYLSKCTKDGG